LQDVIHVVCEAPPIGRLVRPVGHEASSLHLGSPAVDGWQPVLGREVHDGADDPIN
jgi:hypothetical protein